MGQQLGARINQGIESTISEEKSRADVISDIAEATSRTPGTINAIISGEINCPPENSEDPGVGAFYGPCASALNETTADDLISAAEEDGCNVGSNREDEDEEEERQASTPVSRLQAAMERLNGSRRAKEESRILAHKLKESDDERERLNREILALHDHIDGATEALEAAAEREAALTATVERAEAEIAKLPQKATEAATEQLANLGINAESLPGAEPEAEEIDLHDSGAVAKEAARLASEGRDKEATALRMAAYTAQNKG